MLFLASFRLLLLSQTKRVAVAVMPGELSLRDVAHTGPWGQCSHPSPWVRPRHSAGVSRELASAGSPSLPLLWFSSGLCFSHILGHLRTRPSLFPWAFLAPVTAPLLQAAPSVFVRGCSAEKNLRQQWLQAIQFYLLTSCKNMNWKWDWLCL